MGSTELAERLGLEGMHALVNGFFEVALAEVHRYEGTVNQFLGDGFMALFGAPLAHEDHARRAALAALGIARALGARPIAVAAGVEITLTVRMGLHTGFVVVGAIGDNLRMDYTAVGDTTHLAARLQQRAEPGAILASEATWRLVEGYVHGELLGPVPVKGLRKPVVVHRLTGVGPRRSPLEGLGPQALSHFVGRDRELEALLDLFDAAREGRGQALGIVGEPGVGKSRLLLEFRHRLRSRPVTYLQGRCLSYGAAIPYVPVVDIVRASAALADADAPETMAEKLRAGLQDAGMDPDAGAPYLLHMLGVKDPAARLDASGPEVVKARTFETLRQMALRGSRQRPLVIEVEDLHWVDRTSEEYFAFLAESLLGAPILLIATYRPGYRPPWGDRSFATQLSLGRLTVDESRAVVRSLLPDADSGDSLAPLILDKAEGNPFFLEELTRAVKEQGLGTDLPVPDTIHGVLTARIDRLAEEPKRVLQTAAVLGREFAPSLLAAIWDGPGPLEPHLRELARLEFLYERTAGDDAVYVFKHALTQDVAEATLLPSRRRELHRRAGEALERLHPERLAELAPRLAHHYVEAEAWGPAAEHARRAAEAARAAFANREALARYDQAITAAQRAGLPPAARLALHDGRASVHAVLGDFDAARADYEAALALARETEGALDEARVLGNLAALWGGHMDYDRGLALGREAVAAAERAGDAPEGQRAVAESRLRVGLMEVNLARLGAGRLELERALERFRQVGDGGGEGRALDALTMATALAGELDTAVAHAQAALPRLAAAGDRQTEASCMASLAFVLFYRGRRAEGEAAREEALARARAIGARAQEAAVHSITGELVEPFGDWGLALLGGECGARRRPRARAPGVDGRRAWNPRTASPLLRRRRRRPAAPRGDAGDRARSPDDALDRRGGRRGRPERRRRRDGRRGRTPGRGGRARRGGHQVRHAGRARPGRADAPARSGPGRRSRRPGGSSGATPQFAVFVADARRIEGEALTALGQARRRRGAPPPGEGRDRGPRRPPGRLAREPRAGPLARSDRARGRGAPGPRRRAAASRAGRRRAQRRPRPPARLPGLPRLPRGRRAVAGRPPVSSRRSAPAGGRAARRPA